MLPINPAYSSEVPIIGLDIGGTKCAVSRLVSDRVEEVLRIPTQSFAVTFPALESAIQELLPPACSPVFGISCGGPLDATSGVILSPPNLASDWHGVGIAGLLTKRFGGRAILMNDANACALAEWKFGAGRGARNLIFLTAGTGMGAGLILNGQLYEGTTGDAGEIGHVRLRAEGPLGFGKLGSVEGFTSGGGIARLAMMRLSAKGAALPVWFDEPSRQTTKSLAEAASRGDVDALAIMREAGEYYGEMLAILIDLFNPERIVLGGIYPRCHALLEPSLRSTLAREALAIPAGRCRILPAELGETIGSHGAVAIALNALATDKA